MNPRYLTRITGLLTGVAAAVALLSLGFSRSTLLGLLERTGARVTDLPRPTTFALGLTRPELLVPLLLVFLAAVAVTEARVEAEANRLLVQATVLLVLVPLLAFVLWGSFLLFYIPDVKIP